MGRAAVVQKSPRRRPVRLAESVREVVTLEHPTAAAIMNRNQPVTEELVDAVVNAAIFTWEGRNPAPALDEDGNFQGTDLDLLSFLVPIARRGAIIEIPQYERRRQQVVRASERKIGSNQFGPVVGLVSNREVFSFSVRLWDGTIAKTDPVTGRETMGAYRNYMIVDVDGHWYSGWSEVVFKPDVAENAFLTERGLWTGNTVVFQNYIHPNRWQSVFGAPYFLLKMLSERLGDEASFYRAEAKRLQGKGITFPKGECGDGYEPPESVGETRAIEVETVETVLDQPEYSGEYTPAEETREGLILAYERQKLLTYTLRPQVQFVLRADEAAYYRYGAGRVAPWHKGSWETGFKPPRGRVAWDRLVLANGFALRRRVKSITQQVAAD